MYGTYLGGLRHNDEYQASSSEEVEREDDVIGGSTDYSEVENDSSDSSVKLGAKHIKKIQKRSSQLLLITILMIEVKAANNSCFSQTSLTA